MFAVAAVAYYMCSDFNAVSQNERRLAPMHLMKLLVITVFLSPLQVQLWGGALVYYHPKSLTSRGQERADFKTSPCKLQPLVGQAGKLVLVGPQDAQSQPDVFQVRVYSLVMSSQPLFFYMRICALFLWVGGGPEDFFGLPCPSVEGSPKHKMTFFFMPLPNLL